MPLVKFIRHDGVEQVVESASGLSVMRAAVDNNVRGIVADCGGALSCATCHVYVDPAWAPRLPAPSTEETDMIECAVDPQDNSRLSCQISLTDALDGLVVHVPRAQF